MEQFNVLTYNVLHGLKVRGWSVEPVESKEEQRARFDQALTSLPEEEQRWIVEGYRKGMGKARRIDFLFHMGDRYSHVQGCVRQALYGEPVPGLGVPGSDHYGVLNTYILGSSDC